jgi:hypothetical protein
MPTMKLRWSIRTMLLATGVVAVLTLVGVQTYNYVVARALAQRPTFYVESDVQGTQIYVNGKYMGETPVSVQPVPDYLLTRINSHPPQNRSFTSRHTDDFVAIEIADGKGGIVRIECLLPKDQRGLAETRDVDGHMRTLIVNAWNRVEERRAVLSLFFKGPKPRFVSPKNGSLSGSVGSSGQVTTPESSRYVPTTNRLSRCPQARLSLPPSTGSSRPAGRCRRGSIFAWLGSYYARSNNVDYATH